MLLEVKNLVEDSNIGALLRVTIYFTQEPLAGAQDLNSFGRRLLSHCAALAVTGLSFARINITNT